MYCVCPPATPCAGARTALLPACMVDLRRLVSVRTHETRLFHRLHSATEPRQREGARPATGTNRCGIFRSLFALSRRPPPATLKNWPALLRLLRVTRRPCREIGVQSSLRARRFLQHPDLSADRVRRERL